MKKLVNLYNKYKEIVNYLIFGVLATIISLGVKWALLFTIFDQSNALQLQISVIISWIVAVLFAYFTNSKIVFESTNQNKFTEFATFILARIFTLLLEMFVMWFFVTFLKLNTDLLVMIFTVISQMIVIISNYILSKLFIFKNK